MRRDIRIWTAGLLAAVAIAAGCATSAPPQGAGFSAERLAVLEKTIAADVDRGRIPGVVMMVQRDGKLVFNKTLGKQDPASAASMREDSIFRIYSMTKPIVSVAAMMLVEEARLALSDPVSKHIPELKGLKVGVERDGKLEMVTSQREPTIQDLLRHTSGYTYGVFGKSMVKDLYTKAGVDASNHTNAEFVQKLATIRGPVPGYGFGLGFAVRHTSGVSSINGTGGDYNWAGLGGTYFWVDPKERLVAVWMMQAPNQRNYYREIYRNLVYGALTGN